MSLGKTGIVASPLAIGTGVHGGNRQSDQTRMGFEKLVGLFRHAYDRGVRCFDLADLYGTHVYFREALRPIPREKVTLLTKLWWRYDGPSEPVAEPYRKKTAAAALERFRHELSTDYIDIVLLHCVTTSRWDREDLAITWTPWPRPRTRKRSRRSVFPATTSAGKYSRSLSVPGPIWCWRRSTPRG